MPHNKTRGNKITIENALKGHKNDEIAQTKKRQINKSVVLLRCYLLTIFLFRSLLTFHRPGKEAKMTV